MIKFFETSVISTYIKYLLENNPLPLYPVINTDQLIVEGCTYIYRHHILKCTKTGIFKGLNANVYTEDYLYVNEQLLATDDDEVVERRKTHWEEIKDKDGNVIDYEPTQGEWETVKGGELEKFPLTVTDDFVRYQHQPIGEFDIIGSYEFGQSIPNFTKTFVSNVNYYDSHTHKELGEYLRCLRDLKDLDIMGLYNCFDYEIATNISLVNDKSTGNIVSISNPKSKIIIVPIKFNRTYTISIDCKFPVLMTPIFFNGRQLVNDSDNKYLGEYLNTDLIQYTSLQYTEPVTYKVDNDPTLLIQSQKDTIDSLNKTACLLQGYEKYLYLAIELPSSNDSTITVLEGDYSSIAEAYISSGRNLDKLSQPQLSRMFRSKLSLLHTNDNQQHPFSDKLINYLCRYTIDNREYIDDNVANVEKAVGYNPPLKKFYPGMWDNDLRYALYNNYMELENEAWINKLDIFGFVDNDIENAVNRGALHILTPEEKGLKPLE